MTSSKAIAAGVGAWITGIIGFYLPFYVPRWDMMPPNVQGYFASLVSAGVTAAIVFYAPANRHTVKPEEQP